MIKHGFFWDALYNKNLSNFDFDSPLIKITVNPIKAGGIMAPLPHHDFSDCSGTHMDGAPPLADIFLSSFAKLLKDFF